jgi:CheY-like chemotaxis protein
MNQRKEDTALGVARARFVDSLSRKAEEIEAALRDVRTSPADAGTREELRKRFHALYASAQVFRIQALAEALKRCLVIIDDARDNSRELASKDLASLEAVLESLSELATGQRPSIIPNMDDAVENTRAYSVPRPSALGMTPHRPAAPAAPPPPAAAPPAAPPPAAPPSPASTRTTSQGIPAAPSAPSPGAPPPRPISSPKIPAARPKSNPAIPAAGARPASPAERPISRPAMPAARTSSPAIPTGGALTKSPAKSSAFVPKGASIPPAKPKAEKRLIASRSAAGVNVDRVLAVLMVGGEPIAQRLTPLFPKSRVEILQTGNEREAIEAGLESAPDVVVVAPSFARMVAESFAEAQLDHVPRVQLVPPSASAADYELAGVTTTIAVNAPPSKMAQSVVDTASRARVLVARRVEAVPARLRGDLAGVEAVVAFDEPGITHFVARELEHLGATVHRASDGERALVLARATRPQLTLTCATLSKVDGAEIVRRIGRDPLLTGVRAVLLDIDEPVRAKMRAIPSDEAARIDAGAGFLRDWAIQAGVTRSRALVALGEGRPRGGRLRGLGALVIFEALEGARADVRVELRDSERTLEVELRAGRPVIATFTATNGDFARGDRAFERVASFVSGRFRVTRAEGDAKGPAVADGALERLSRELTRRSVVLELLDDGALESGAKIELDEELVAASGLDEALAQALHSVTTVESVQALLGAARARERLLGFAQLGAITRITSATSGADLVAQGLARRGEPSHASIVSNDLSDTTPGRMPAAHPASSPAAEPSTLDDDLLEARDLESLPPVAVDAAVHVHVPAAPPLPAAPPISAAPPMPVAAPPPMPRPASGSAAAGPPSLPEHEAPLAAEPFTPPPIPRRGLGGGVIAILVTLLVAGLGFAAIELFDLQSLVKGTKSPESEDPGVDRAALAPVEEPEATPALQDPFPAIARYYGDRREGIIDSKVSVPKGHGLVVVEAPADGAGADVFIGSENLGKTPISKALPPGRAEITLVRGSEKKFRYVFVEPGVTRVLSGE